MSMRIRIQIGTPLYIFGYNDYRDSVLDSIHSQDFSKFAQVFLKTMSAVMFIVQTLVNYITTTMNYFEISKNIILLDPKG